ncbi:MAG: hypothetical protein LBP20_06165 [Treponema sp.]|jgi:hypothetical protein|nr:hypothetical protein [Treponema sp.]
MRNLKNAEIRAVWIAGLFLVGWLLWFFTEVPRNRELARRVNRILTDRGETIVLSDIPVKNRRSVPLGTEFTLEAFDGREAGGSFLVFPLVSGAAAISCGALIDPWGRVERLIPLGTHGEQIFDHIPAGVLNGYIRRIEGGKNL